VADLAREKCVPCRGDSAKVTAPEMASLMGELPGWRLIYFTVRNRSDSAANTAGDDGETESKHAFFVDGRDDGARS